MTTLYQLLITLAVTAPTCICFGVLLERDRVVRFPTVGDRLPAARMTRRQRRNLVATRADLRAALRRPAP